MSTYIHIYMYMYIYSVWHSYRFLDLSGFSTGSESGDPETWQFWPLPLHILTTGTAGTTGTGGTGGTGGWSVRERWDVGGPRFNARHVTDTGS